jgi:hypothetical protein
MKKRKSLAICIIVILSIVLVAVAYDEYARNQIDTSWIQTTNKMLTHYSDLNESQLNGLDVSMSMQVRLVENNTKSLLHYGENELTNCLLNLANNAIIQKGTLTLTQLEDVLAKSKTIELTQRFWLDDNFILESSEYQNLVGCIIIKDTQSLNYNIQEVDKLPAFL